ncbi:HEAT repeat domain-containing protein [Embleya sp. NPDC008237]|uniref:HEAT repeat domain-containing protein n=1 Tax=Embleya sp. NPDC008237 TaxID=3363978 RepID=UPI0036EF869D
MTGRGQQGHHQEVSGGTQYGPVIQARDIHNLTMVLGPDEGAGRPRRVGVGPEVAQDFQERGIETGPDRPDRSGRAVDVIVRSRVLFGMGGAGKTQLAAHYARRSWDSGELDLLVWVTASSREAIVARYAEAAEQVTGTIAHSGDEERSAARFLSWLSSDTDRRWLIVLDDLVNPAHLRGLLPPMGNPLGRTLTTTRLSGEATRALGARIPVGEFTRVEARDYLQARLAGRGEPVDHIDGMAADLGRLPLALSHAASFILDRNLMCAEYRRRFHDRSRQLAELFPERDWLPDGYEQTIATTWSLSMEAADRLNPIGLAAPLLQFAGLLDPNGTPLRVFTMPACLDWLKTACRRDGSRAREVEAEHARDALYNLRRFSLVALDAAEQVHVHALVQRATREDLEIRDLQAAADSRRFIADALRQAWDADPDSAHWSLLSMWVGIADLESDDRSKREVFHRLLNLLDNKESDVATGLAWAATQVIKAHFACLFPLVLECLAGEPVGGAGVGSRLSPEPRITQQAASSLAYSFEALADWEAIDSDRRGVPILRDGLVTWPYRKRFIEALTKYSHPDALEALREFAEQQLAAGIDADPEALAAVAKALAELEHKLAPMSSLGTGHLLERIASRRVEPWIRRAAIQGMNLVTGREEPIPEIGESETITRLDSPDWRVVEEYAGYAADRIKAGESSEALRDALLHAFARHRDPTARVAIVKCLGKLTDQSAHQALRAGSMRDVALVVRQACVEALGAARAPAVGDVDGFPGAT